MSFTLNNVLSHYLEDKFKAVKQIWKNINYSLLPNINSNPKVAKGSASLCKAKVGAANY